MAKHQPSDANAPRRRSALYPSVSIMESLRFTTLIASIGPEVSYEALLEKMGISSHTTRNFAFRLGSSKQYGLVTADGHTILLTDLAKEVLAQAEPSRSVLLTLFRNPPPLSAAHCPVPQSDSSHPSRTGRCFGEGI